MNIINYLKVNDWIQTSGQPKAEEFELISDSGADTVINLALPDHKEAISNEGSIVTGLGMNFIHIPVVWKSPQSHQYQLFESIMQAHHQQGKSLWIHCALNWRVASFIYLYRTRCLGVSADDAKSLLHQIWEPDEVWSEFIKKNK